MTKEQEKDMGKGDKAVKPAMAAGELAAVHSGELSKYYGSELEVKLDCEQFKTLIKTLGHETAAPSAAVEFVIGAFVALDHNPQSAQQKSGE